MNEPILPVISENRCTGCGICVCVCHAGVLEIDSHVRLARPDLCDYCGDCEAVCAEHAITCPFEIILEPVR